MKPLIFALLLMSAGLPAQAQSRCGLAVSMMMGLEMQYGERVVETITRDEGAVILELWVNSSEGTYTVTVRGDDGAMCLLAAGREYDGRVLRDFVRFDEPA